MVGPADSQTSNQVRTGVIEAARSAVEDATQFLYREAALLDRGEFQAWLELLTTDFRYTVPVRSTRYGRTSDEFSSTSFHFNEDLFSLTMRVQRLQTRFAWAEDPPSRSRHLVTNVLVEPPEPSAGELRVTSNVLLLRTRFDNAEIEQLSGERDDVLRMTHQGLRLARRNVYLDQTTLPISSITTLI